jgi:hypothetical protein
VSVADADLTNFGQAAKAIMTPYPASPLVSSITEVYIDSVSGIARVQWSKGLTIDTVGNVSIAPGAPHNQGEVVALPTTLSEAKGTYVIWSEVSYKYTPAVGYILAKTGLTFKDAAVSPRDEHEAFARRKDIGSHPFRLDRIRISCASATRNSCIYCLPACLPNGQP